MTSPLGRRDAVVEPFGSYTVGRLHKDWDKGNTSLGGMVTSTHRWVNDPSLAFLPTQATTGGVDFTRYFDDRAWVLEANGVVSHVQGDPEAILALQTNAVHYYQRPDATHLGVDPTPDVPDRPRRARCASAAPTPAGCASSTTSTGTRRGSTSTTSATCGRPT